MYVLDHDLQAGLYPYFLKSLVFNIIWKNKVFLNSS